MIRKQKGRNGMYVKWFLQLMAQTTKQQSYFVNYVSLSFSSSSNLCMFLSCVTYLKVIPSLVFQLLLSIQKCCHTCKKSSFVTLVVGEKRLLALQTVLIQEKLKTADHSLFGAQCLSLYCLY